MGWTIRGWNPGRNLKMKAVYHSETSEHLPWHRAAIPKKTPWPLWAPQLVGCSRLVEHKQLAVMNEPAQLMQHFCSRRHRNCRWCRVAIFTLNVPTVNQTSCPPPQIPPISSPLPSHTALHKLFFPPPATCIFLFLFHCSFCCSIRSFLCSQSSFLFPRVTIYPPSYLLHLSVPSVHHHTASHSFLLPCPYQTSATCSQLPSDSSNYLAVLPYAFYTSNLSKKLFPNHMKTINAPIIVLVSKHRKEWIQSAQSEGLL